MFSRAGASAPANGTHAPEGRATFLQRTRNDCLMLESLRRGASGWIAKIFFVVLVFSFAVWGVADVFRGYGQGSLATVGKTEISVEDYQQAFQSEIDRVSRMFGRRLTTEQARQFGLDRTVLTRLVDSAAVDTHAQRLNLALSDEVVVKGIRDIPGFKGPDGKFSRLQFDEVLRQNGLTESRFLDIRRLEEVREQLTSSMLSGVQPPAPLIEMLHKYREEARTLSYFTLDPQTSVKIEEPDDAKLKEYYEQNRSQFVIPEYRSVTLLSISATDVKKKISVPDADLTAAYERDKDLYAEPERRHIYQISFPDHAAAEKAAVDLVKTGNFLEDAKALGFKESDIDLGTLSRKDIIDKTIADAAFALEKGKVSAPVAGRFTTVLLYVSDIVPGKQRTFDEVKDQVREKIAGPKAHDEIEELHRKVDDERAAGRSLKEIAETLKLGLREIPAVSRTGSGTDGKPALEGPEAERVVAAAFEGKVGLESEVIEGQDGGLTWVDVAGVTPQKDKPFEDAKEEVRTAYSEAERKKALTQLAQKLVERLNKGEPMDAIATSVGATAKVIEGVKRSATPEGVSKRAIDIAFTIAKGSSTSAESADAMSRTVIRVDDIKAADLPTTSQAEAASGELSRQMQNDFFSEYVNELKERYAVRINQAEFNRVLGLDVQR